MSELPAKPVDYLEGLMEGFVAYDANWVMTYMNASGERLLGRRREDVLGKTWHQAFPHAVGNPVDHMYQRVKSTRVPESMEYHYGHYRMWMEISASPASDGGVGVYFRDISDRKNAEAELRRMAAVAESSNDFIGMCTPDMVAFYVNPAGRRMVGLEGADVSRTRVLDYFHPEERARIEHEAIPALQRDGRWSGEVRFRNFRTGATIPTMWNAFQIKDEDGRVVAWATISPDLSSLKRAERALQEANAKLLESARRKDEFLATLAHELRNPLAPIVNSVEVLNLQGSADPVAREARAVIGRQLRLMRRLIDDLLDASRITTGKLELRREPVELAAVLEQALETSRPHLRGHELTLALPPEAVWLDADAVRLAQVFSNLINNACKYSPPGGPVRLSVERQGVIAKVRVKDSGIGIAREHLPRLFEMFSQLAAPREHRDGGLGIGLALSRALVEMHGGAIAAASDGPGTGAEFTVTLPVSTPSAPRKEEGVRASGRPQRILVVEDNVDSAESLAQLLRADGHTVEVAHDGERAVQVASAFRPNTVLLDIGLPRMSGLEACRAIRAQPGGERIVIAALTGWGQEEDERRSLEAGFDAHLVKPVGRDALAALLAGTRA